MGQRTRDPADYSCRKIIMEQVAEVHQQDRAMSRRRPPHQIGKGGRQGRRCERVMEDPSTKETALGEEAKALGKRSTVCSISLLGLVCFVVGLCDRFLRRR